GHDVGQAELPADLDELATGDDDLPASGDSVQDDGGSGGIVVDDGCVLAGRKLVQEPGEAFVAAGPLAGLGVDLEDRVATKLLLDLIYGALRQDGPAQAGVQNDAGGVDR